MLCMVLKASFPSSLKILVLEKTAVVLVSSVCSSLLQVILVWYARGGCLGNETVNDTWRAFWSVLDTSVAQGSLDVVF